MAARGWLAEAKVFNRRYRKCTQIRVPNRARVTRSRGPAAVSITKAPMAPTAAKIPWFWPKCPRYS